MSSALIVLPDDSTRERVRGMSRGEKERSPSEVLHVDVRAQSGVVREVPADVVGIVVNHDRIAIPEPAVDEAVVPWRDAEEEAVEPEPPSVPSLEVEHMAAAEPAREPPVLKRMIEVIVGITTAGLVSDPASVAVNVGRIGMPRLVAKVARPSVIMRRATASHRGRPVFRSEATTDAMSAAATRPAATGTMATAAVLCIGWNSTRQRKSEKSDHWFHTPTR
jgi:hypothetical protein